MRTSKLIVIGTLTAVLLGVAACQGGAETNGEAETNPELTWQDAKSGTLARAGEIAALVPASEVASINQSETGTLMSCDATQHNWNGWVRITLVSGSSVAAALEALVPAAESQFAGTEFSIARSKTILDTPRIQVEKPGTAELYLIDEFDPTTINITAGSDCFALPADVYPRGDF